MYFKNLLLCTNRDQTAVPETEVTQSLMQVKAIIEIVVPVLERSSDYEKDPEKEIVLLDALRIIKILQPSGVLPQLRLDPLMKILSSNLFSQKILVAAL